MIMTSESTEPVTVIQDINFDIAVYIYIQGYIIATLTSKSSYQVAVFSHVEHSDLIVSHMICCSCDILL